MANAVLLPLDGSTFAEAALPQAISLAARLKAVLHLVRVRQYQAIPSGPMISAESEDRAALETYLDSVAERVRRVSTGPIHTEVVEGPVVEAIEDYVLRAGITVVALSTHGRHGLSRVRLGSVADALLHRLAVPMLVVRPPEGDKAVELVTPVAPGCQTVIVGLDGSALAAAILPTAEAYAATWRVPLLLVTVVEPPLPAVVSGLEFSAVAPMDPTVLERAVRRAEERLEFSVASLARRGCQATAKVEVAATAAEGLHNVAARTPGAVLAIATHGLSGFKRLIRGSVTDQLLRETPVPLLIWRPKRSDIDAAMDREAALATR